MVANIDKKQEITTIFEDISTNRLPMIVAHHTILAAHCLEKRHFCPTFAVKRLLNAIAL